MPDPRRVTTCRTISCAVAYLWKSTLWGVYMNLAKLEDLMISGDLSSEAAIFLVGCRAECEWLDYKQDLHLEAEKELCDFARDVMAMKNTGGGYIVVGMKDRTWKAVGLPDDLPYDSKMIRDKVRKATGNDIEVILVHHDIQADGAMRRIALIFVRSSKKRKRRRIPTPIHHDFCTAKPYGLRRGEIYARSGDSTVRINSREQLEELLDELEAQADDDALRGSGVASPFAIQAGTYRLLEKGYDTFIGRDALRSQVLDSVTRDPRIWIINVHGPGGVGKSALVNWATYELYRRNDFESIIQLTAKETVLTDQGIQRFQSRSLYSLENLLDHVLSTFLEPTDIDLEKKRTTAIDILSTYKTLLVLDNMETVSDGRILTFLQGLPPSSKAKALLTSRTKTGGWELSVPVSELGMQEFAEFLRVKTQEMGVAFPLDKVTSEKVLAISGGLPLAIQWIIGRFRATKDIHTVLNDLNTRDSPVLEFSFRNIWNVISPDAQATLGVMTIFDSPPTAQQITIATEWPLERVENALAELSEVTLVTPTVQSSDGQLVHSFLPITRSFALNQFHSMGEFEIRCRQRFNKFSEQLRLQQSELHRFTSTFERYGLQTDHEKKGAILCTRGQSEMFSGNTDNAELLFKQARDIAPTCAYVFAMSASYEIARNRIGRALEHAKAACKLANKQTGSLCYTILARVMDVQRDRNGRVEALKKALAFDPSDVMTRHQFGVALSRIGRTEDAIEEFTKIIDQELNQPSPTLLMALKTRIINLRRIGRGPEAEQDLKTARRLISENPFLQHQGRHFEETLE